VVVEIRSAERSLKSFLSFFEEELFQLWKFVARFLHLFSSIDEILPRGSILVVKVKKKKKQKPSLSHPRKSLSLLRVSLSFLSATKNSVSHASNTSSLCASTSTLVRRVRQREKEKKEKEKKNSLAI
tara:strand:- start:236 stop:616 length:381 start_codon:yes stop_codon:yes gene_type:complete